MKNETDGEFRDIDGTVLSFLDTVVVVYGGLPIGRLIKGEVVDIGKDYVEIHSENNKESIFVFKSEQILFLYSWDGSNLNEV